MRNEKISPNGTSSRRAANDTLRTVHYKLKSCAALEGGNREPVGVLLNTHSAGMNTCNETAWVLLQTLKEGAELEDLTAILVATFDVEEEDASKDVTSFIRKLGAMGLVNERP